MVQNFGMIKEMKIALEGPMYTHNNFCTSASVHAINVKRPIVWQRERNVVGTGAKAHQDPLEGLE